MGEGTVRMQRPGKSFSGVILITRRFRSPVRVLTSSHTSAAMPSAGAFKSRPPSMPPSPSGTSRGRSARPKAWGGTRTLIARVEMRER